MSRYLPRELDQLTDQTSPLGLHASGSDPRGKFDHCAPNAGWLEIAAPYRPFTLVEEYRQVQYRGRVDTEGCLRPAPVGAQLRRGLVKQSDVLTPVGSLSYVTAQGSAVRVGTCTAPGGANRRR